MANPVRMVEFQETPNPHAVKAVVSTPLADARPGKSSKEGADGLRSYSSADGARDDDVASALFAIAGVVGVLVTPGWVTVRKSVEASWGELQPRIRALLERAT